MLQSLNATTQCHHSTEAGLLRAGLERGHEVRMVLKPREISTTRAVVGGPARSTLVVSLSRCPVRAKATHQCHYVHVYQLLSVTEWCIKKRGGAFPTLPNLGWQPGLASRHHRGPSRARHGFMMPLVRALVCWYVCVYIKLVLLLPVGSPLHHCS